MMTKFMGESCSLEIITAHRLIVPIAPHAFDASIRKVLTRVVEPACRFAIIPKHEKKKVG